MKPFFLYLRDSIFNRKILSAFLIVGYLSVFLCLFFTASSAKDEYESSLNINYLSSVSFTVDEENQIDDSRDYSALLEKNFDDLLNVLYITNDAEGNTIIGWYGYEPAHWFPLSTGRFFTFSDNENRNNVVYIGDSEYSGLIGKQSSLSLNGYDFEIIGSGYLSPFNFRYPINSKSEQKIFVSTMTEDYSFRIIPYTVFFDNYSPELILVQFNNPSYSDLKERCNKLEELLPGTTVLLPDKSSDMYLVTEKIKRMSVGAFLSATILISMIGIFSEFIKIRKNLLRTFYICGLSTGKLQLIVCLEQFLYIIVAEITVIVFQVLLKEHLAVIGVGSVPEIGEILFITILIFSIMIIGAHNRIKKIQMLSVGEEELKS